MKFVNILALCALAMVPRAASAAYSLAPYQNFATDSWADAVAVGDINGDGRDDVALTTGNSSTNNEETAFKVFVFFQNDGGSLDAPRIYGYLTQTGRSGLALADLDHDDRMDIVVGHARGITILRWGKVHGGMGMRSRLHPADIAADDVAIVDIDRDGAPDVIAQSWSEGATIFYNDGHGNISHQALLATQAQGYNDMESGDLNGDGYDDLVVLSGQGPTLAYVYYNDGSDDFSAPIAVNPNPDEFATGGAIGIGDFNADGRNDLAAIRDIDHLSLFHQDGTGALGSAQVVPSAVFPNAIMSRDLDNDGRDDLVVLHGSGVLGTYLQGDEGLAPEVAWETPDGSWLNTQGLDAGDVNGDGCVDVVSAHYSYGLVVHLGQGCSPTADLAGSVGLTSTHVAVRLDNFGPAAVVDPEVAVTLSIASGSLTMGALPAGCAMQSQTARAALVQCQGGSLAADTSRTLVLPISVDGGDRRNVLTASVEARTTTMDRHLRNNDARRLLRLSAFGAPARTQSRSAAGAGAGAGIPKRR